MTENVQDRIFMLMKEGIFALNRKANDEVEPVGWIPPDIFLKSYRPPTVNTKTHASGILARDLIYYEQHQSSNKTVYKTIYELTPRLGTIKFYKDRYDLSLPYFQFYFSIKILNKAILVDSFASCSIKKLKALTDEVCAIPMNNVGDTGYICWGSNSVDSAQLDWSSYGRSLCDQFLGSTFNDHIPPYEVPPELAIGYNRHDNRTHKKLYENWAAITKTDPLIGLKLKYGKHPQRTAQGIVECLRIT